MATDEFYTVQRTGDVVVVTFRHSQILDAVTIERISANLKDLIDERGEDRFVFDLSLVTYLSSSALGMLIGIQRRVAQTGARLKLCGISEDIMEVFQITKLDTVFDIYKDVPAALEAFNKNQ